MDDLIPSQDGLPGCRRLPGLTFLTIRHFPGDGLASKMALAQGLIWPSGPGALVGVDPFLAWRSPQEALAVGFRAGPLEALLTAMAPGQTDSAVAANLSDAMVAIEVHGPFIDRWMAHLVDYAVLPREPGFCARGRMADVAVLLLRLQTDRLWLIVDRPIAAYVENWLAFSYEGAFASSS